MYLDHQQFNVSFGSILVLLYINLELSVSPLTSNHALLNQIKLVGFSLFELLKYIPSHLHVDCYCSLAFLTPGSYLVLLLFFCSSFLPFSPSSILLFSLTLNLFQTLIFSHHFQTTSCFQLNSCMFPAQFMLYCCFVMGWCLFYHRVLLYSRG